MSKQEEIRQRLKNDGFYEVYAFFKDRGTWTTTSVYGIMSEVYRDLTITPDKPKGRRLDTGCRGCIEAAAELIYNTYPL
jgi:hypothetical protein